MYYFIITYWFIGWILLCAEVYGRGRVTLRDGVRLVAAGSGASARTFARGRYPHHPMGFTQLALAWQSGRPVSEPLVSEPALDRRDGERLPCGAGKLSQGKVIL